MTDSKTCAVCGQAAPAADLLFSEEGQVCASCATGLDLSRKSRPVPPYALLGIVAGAVPFFASVTETTSVNGVVTRQLDYVALACGLVCLLVAALLGFRLSRRRIGGAVVVAVALAVAVAGAMHLSRGAGLFVP